MTNQQDKHQRAILPIPDRPYTGLITYDAKDPETISRRSSPSGRRRVRRTYWSS